MFDGQHLHISRILDGIESELAGAADLKVLDEFLFDLSQVTVSHLANEETFFRDIDYADAEAHVADHRKLVERLTHLSIALAKGEPALDRGAVRDLRAWFNRHLKEFDAPFSRMLLGRGDLEIVRRTKEASPERD